MIVDHRSPQIMKVLSAVLLICGLVAVSNALALKQADAKPLCSFCEQLIQYIETQIEDEGAPLEKQVNEACDVLTKDNPVLDPICKSIADGQIQQVENEIKNKDKPDLVCKKIKLC
uniref:Saposin B-type domain-containing protein n=1 Tax=Steinernema glaseri TaxID=37863 RepID=A0A1I8AUZ2_9BILA